MHLHEWAQGYEDFVLSVGTRPTITLLVAIWTMLLALGIVGYRREERSFRTWVWFSASQVGIWVFFAWATHLSPAGTDHARLFLIHLIVVTGGLFVAAMFRRVVLGKEGERP